MSDAFKLAVAAGLLFLGLGGASLIQGISDGKPAVAPSDDLPIAYQTLATPVRSALLGYPANEKALWRELWTQTGAVVASDTAAPVDFATTTALRELVIEMLTSGWVTLGGNARGQNPKLDAAVNELMLSIVGDKEIGVTPELRRQFVDACRALAWAGR